MYMYTVFYMYTLIKNTYMQTDAINRAQHKQQ